MFGADTGIVYGAKTGIVMGGKTSFVGGLKTSFVGGAVLSVNMSLAAKLTVGGAMHYKIGGFLKVEGPFVASIGYGAKLSKKPETQFNVYGLKVEKINIAEIKQAMAGFSNTFVKLNKHEVRMSTFGVALENTIGAKMITNTMSLHL